MPWTFGRLEAKAALEPPPKKPGVPAPKAPASSAPAQASEIRGFLSGSSGESGFGEGHGGFNLLINGILLGVKEPIDPITIDPNKPVPGHPSR